MTTGDKKDVGFIEDALNVIENMVCAEHHCANTYVQTKDKDFIDVLTMIRRERSKLLFKIVPENMGELYCLNKHMSAVIEGYKELANRMLEDGETETAQEYIELSKKYEDLLILLNTEKGGRK